MFPKGIANTYTLVGKIPGKFPMEATSNTFPGVLIQGFWRQSDVRDIGDQNPGILFHREGVGIWAMGGDRGVHREAKKCALLGPCSNCK